MAQLTLSNKDFSIQASSFIKYLTNNFILSLQTKHRTYRNSIGGIVLQNKMGYVRIMFTTII